MPVVNGSTQRFEFDYPRTFHLPFSPGMANDDKRIATLEHFIGKEVVITEKLDGENTTLLRNGFHARSLDSPTNYTRAWIKILHSLMGHEIPEGWRLCGENMGYFHSIEYNDLESFFYLFSIWDENNMRLHYDETVEFAQIWDLAMPRVFDRFIFDEDRIEKFSKDLAAGKLKDFPGLNTQNVEGFVVSLVEPIHYSEFGIKTAKWVRAGHVQPEADGSEAEHWLKSTYPNKIGADKVLKPQVMEYYTKR